MSNTKSKTAMSNDRAGDPVVSCKKTKLMFDFKIDEKELEFLYEPDESATEFIYEVDDSDVDDNEKIETDNK